MANRNFPSSRLFSMHMKPIILDVAIPIGSTGAVGTISGPGIASVTRLSAGRYQIQLQDSYAKFIGMDARIASPVTGSALNVDASDAQLSVGTVYQIVTLGTSTAADFVAIGVPAGIAAAPGVIFKAAATGSGTGTGTVKAIGVSAIHTIELIGNPALMLNNQPAVPLLGGYINLQCLGATDASTTTLIPTDPASGSTLYVKITLNDSQVQ